MSEGFLDREKFSRRVERAVFTKRLSYMEAAVHACEEVGLDPLDVRKFLTKVILDKIEAEAIELKLLPRGTADSLI